MELSVARFQKTEKSSIGRFGINSQPFCYSLEDKDRGLAKDQDITLIQKTKQYGVTAIPKGKYEVVITYSERFKKYLPLLLNVPGFGGVRIHPGNTDVDTEGCILVGENYSKDFVGSSRLAFARLMVKLKLVEQTEKIYITIS